jgi:hypothetical protein
MIYVFINNFLNNLIFFIMQKLFKFLSFLIVVTLVGVLSSCDKDEKETPLVPAFVTVPTSYQLITVTGDVSVQDIDVTANREIKIEPLTEDWITASVKAFDLESGAATISISVTKNETAFKGRNAVVKLSLVPLKEGDDVSKSTAKAEISVTQSLFGLPIATVFDLKLNPDGTAADGTGNLKVENGPDKPKVVMNESYKLLEATFSDMESKDYTKSTNADEIARGWNIDPGNKYYLLYNRENESDPMYYDSWEKDAGGNIVPIKRKQGNRRMCYYKMSWGGTDLAHTGQNEKLVNAYNSAFSYELLVTPPTDEGVGGNIFGNINPSHCGFGIGGNGGRYVFTYSTGFGGLTPVQPEVPTVQAGVPYHLVVTYSKTATPNIVIYYDGKKAGEVTDPALKEHGIKFPGDYYVSSNGDHTSAFRTPNTEYLVIGGGSHQSGMPTFGLAHDTKIMIARVYDTALTELEVKALYDYTKPE